MWTECVVLYSCEEVDMNLTETQTGEVQGSRSTCLQLQMLNWIQRINKPNNTASKVFGYEHWTLSLQKVLRLVELTSYERLCILNDVFNAV